MFPGRTLLKYALAACAVTLAVSTLTSGCGNKQPQGALDAGEDASVVVDAGGDAGVDAGVVKDAGVCDVELQNCPADAGSCILYSLDGGLGEETACFGGECDLVRQDCDAGFKCTYVGTDAGFVRGCAPEGAVDEGQPCLPTASSNNCKRGLVCSTRPTQDGGSESTCTRFCNRSSECTNGQLCYVLLAFAGSTERPLTCGEPPRACDLLAQDCPRPQDGCYPGEGGIARCYPAGPGLTGQGCSYSNDCVKRSLCLDFPTTGKECRELCSYPTGAATCTTGACKALGIPDAGYCG